MSILEELAEIVRSGVELKPGQVADAAARLAGAEESDEIKGAFLAALAIRGETPREVAGFARYFRDRAIDPGFGALSEEAIDVVGTGGDHAGGFNVSSVVTLVLASCGVRVIKHGNRGITSKCGSADLLAALGFGIEAPPAKLRSALEQLGYCFLFAPAFHPAFRQIAPVRKALAARGQRTLFNVLGPLVNPARPGRILLGVYSPDLVDRLAGALDELGCGAGLVVHGIIGQGRGIDEATTATTNVLRGAGKLRSTAGYWEPEDFGLRRAPFSDLASGDVAANVAIVEGLLAGRGAPGLVETILLNASIALWICGRVAQPAHGIAMAREALLGGAVAAKVTATRAFFQS